MKQMRTMRSNIGKSVLATAGLVGFTVCAGLVLSGSTVSADDVVDDVSIIVPVSCTMRGYGMNTHTMEVTNGTYRADIGTTTLKVTCNDNGGFSVYAAGFTESEIGQTNSNKLVGTSASGNATIDTGTATSAGNPDVSNWAMKLATDTQATYPITLTTGYDAYHAVPNGYTKVATRTQGTDVGTSAVGSTLTTTYAAYISKAQVADTYSGKVKYTIVHPYDEPAPTPPPTPVSQCTTKVPGITFMQDLNDSNTATIMDNMTENTQYYLRDARDEEPYCVSKIAGAIWMTQNLRIKGTIPAEGSNFTGNDVNISECDLDATVGECTDASNRSSRDIPMTHDSGNTTNGVWYNYAAASAKTIVGTSNANPATEDICPTNWTMPSYDTNSPAGSVNSLVGGSSAPTTIAFHPVTGGGYENGSVVNSSNGYWWTTISASNGARYRFSYYGSDTGTSNYYRNIGLYVRCVRVPAA